MAESSFKGSRTVGVTSEAGRALEIGAMAAFTASWSVSGFLVVMHLQGLFFRLFLVNHKLVNGGLGGGPGSIVPVGRSAFGGGFQDPLDVVEGLMISRATVGSFMTRLAAANAGFRLWCIGFS